MTINSWQANPPQLHSNLQYIQRYRRQSRLVSEAAYFFTNIFSAESFIWNIDAQSLSMDEAEYQRNVDSARALLLGLSSYSESPESQINETVQRKVEATKTERGINSLVKEKDLAQGTDDPNKDHRGKDQLPTNRLSVADLEKHGAAELLKEDQLGRYLLDYPFLHADAGDLTIEDVENLLNSYKQLALKYLSLCKGRGVTNISALSASTVQETITESKAESGDSAKIVINSENFGGLHNSKSTETFGGSSNNKSSEKLEGLSNNQSNDDLSSVLDDIERKIPTNDSISQPVVEE